MSACVKSILLVLLFTLLAARAPAQQRNTAAQQDKIVTLVERIQFTGEVERVLMIAMADSSPPEIVDATWIAPHEGDEFACIGRVTLPDVAQRLQVVSIIVGTRGEVRSAYREFAAEEIPPTAQLSLAELRNRFVERRGVFRKLQNETQGLDERLRTLQRDADNIAMVSRIVSAEEHVSDVHARLARLAAAQQSIDHRAAQIKTRPQPLNAQKREAELVGQLGQLSQALSAAETQALTRLKGAKGALQEKLELIEQTRDQHITLLEEDLARLQSGR
jgi:hypothetical protein